MKRRTSNRRLCEGVLQLIPSVFLTIFSITSCSAPFQNRQILQDQISQPQSWRRLIPIEPARPRDNKPVVALLAEISASLKDPRDHSALNMRLRHRTWDQNSNIENGGRGERRSTRVESCRRSSQSVRSTSYLPYDYSNSGTEGSDKISEKETEESYMGYGKVIKEVIGKFVEELVEDRGRFTLPEYRDVIVKDRRILVNSRNHSRPSRRNQTRLEVGEQSAEIVDELSGKTIDQDHTTSTDSDETRLLPLKGYINEEVECGDLLHADLGEQLFGNSRGLRGADERDLCSSWLKDKRLVFSPDERCRFKFGNANLADCEGLYKLKEAVGNIERFARKAYRNKIYNGTHALGCKDDMGYALPVLSEGGKTFAKNFAKNFQKTKGPKG
ncbi:uncharacterized protein BDR25DRAFT_355051 [Lindgomyces ingoldianus]|uniref:Uncharacterized protein n=1 Tax=Lindgomyces ingoldianus TaxID=673940 RepID=A0ACB6QU99_9PLEO|nr:uncharacterized protein BDR25DRAFT_355051 [Lindgomyces ingoldianus]KAF2470563.1 hypothetical protein BDR25DRAFT_355051 [Lindgomyces ingoldianus]